jgi:hypothetical protein
MNVNFRRNRQNNNAFNNNRIIGTNVEVCDFIYNRLIEFYRDRNDFECRIISKSFYWALQDYVHPHFVPRNILEGEAIPIIEDNQIMIMHFCIPIGEYHYITVCKNGDRYKIYNAFGAHFINPFEVPIGEFTQSIPELLNYTTLENYTQAWNTVIGIDFTNYYKKNISDQLLDSAEVHIEDEDVLAQLRRLNVVEDYDGFLLLYNTLTREDTKFLDYVITPVFRDCYQPQPFCILTRQ